MTLLGLMRKNALRKPLRTLMLALCVCVAFIIYGLSQGFLKGAQSASAASDNVIGVMSAAGGDEMLPLAMRVKIAGAPDVEVVSPMVRLRGYVGTERNRIPISAVDPQALFAANGDELGLDASLVASLSGSRDKILVGRALASTQGWSVGQRIAVTVPQLRKENGDSVWTFEIAGIFEGKSASTDTYFGIGRYDYVNAARAEKRDTVNAFIVRPKAGFASQVAAELDRDFVNSAHPTRTQSEKQYLEAFLRQYADIGLIANLIIGASFVTLLLITINTMVFAVGERIFEIGLLKTIGFSQRVILSLVLGETLGIFLCGGCFGLMLAGVAVRFAGPDLGLVFTTSILAKCLIIILALGLATGVLPALIALRTPITAAFRRR
ncbi:ABC transporter permease [Oryzifoliimicrobium ureilyticus]|uniref:ABC transporter permease n=1 Tax=Oryzifoliimicrobium ureilyticus TaxID=3113724 RepID=UPI003076702F